MAPIRIGQEVGAKKTFVWVIDWPGWCRGAKTVELAVGALLEATPRYAEVAKLAGLELPKAPGKGLELETIESVPASAGTDFGIPYGIGDDDRRAVTSAQAKRLAALVEATWTTFDRVAADAPPTLRKGPRGGGRDRDKMIDHVVGADHAYAREIGVKLPEPSWKDQEAVEAERAAVLEVLASRSDGSALAGRKWTARYAARRIAWHALDHAWEMEDRSER